MRASGSSQKRRKGGIGPICIGPIPLQKAKLPDYGLPLLTLGHEQMARITLGSLFNRIARSDFETGLPAPITPVVYEIGQRCRIEILSLRPIGLALRGPRVFV